MRTAAVFLLGLAMAVGCAAGRERPADPPKPSEAFRDGEAALLLGDFPAAEAAFAQALAGAGADADRAAEVSYWLGVCRRKLRNGEGARAAWARALVSTNPRIAALARLGLGDLAWEARGWLEAREMYSGAARDLSVLTTDELLHVRRRSAQAAIRAGDWSDGQARFETWGPSEEPEGWALVRHVASGGQFACVLGPFSALDAERRLEDLDAAGRTAEPWSRGATVWIVVRPFDDWEAAEAEAATHRAKATPAAALP